MSTLDLYGNEEIKIEMKYHKSNIVSTVGQRKASFPGANDQLISPDSDISQRFEENRNLQMSSGFSTELAITGQGSLSAVGHSPAHDFSGSCAPLTRQFWNAGDYEVQPSTGPASLNGQNRLCVHPKFLHSNATSHKWAFGAIAELLDNAVDEICNGATFVIADKITIPLNGNPALLIQDDGGGMDPESLRRCMSFGFSDKLSCSAIGQYGNGFKTSTMRLGADVIVFSCCKKESVLIRSIGLLSYTFLRQEGCNDVLVPAVDYYYNPSSGLFTKLLRNGKKQFLSNLSMLLKWSPFPTENELLKNFNDIGHHGTKIIIYNLWFNDVGDLELDFESNEKDIMISGAPKQVKTNAIAVMLRQNHIANRIRCSLRAYSSILYLRTPEYFRIILRGWEVERHNIANDLKFCECIKYKPQVGGRTEAEVVTTIGFLKDAPLINVHGFNIYHKNRLILPFCHVASASGSRGRGVVGVLEANFIKPTHDKQGFEKSSLYQKLESRLREMTYEYWEYHCHLVGYGKKISHSTPPPASVPYPIPASSGCNVRPVQMNPEFPPDTRHESSHSLPVGVARKRGHEEIIAANEPLKRQALCSSGKEAGERTNYKLELGNCTGQSQVREIRILMQENKSFRKECLEYEKTEKGLLLKVQKLTLELEQVQQWHKKLLVELSFMDGVKVDKP